MVRCSPNLTFLLEITDTMSYRPKEEERPSSVLSASVQKPASLMVGGCISAYGMDSLHVLEGL